MQLSNGKDASFVCVCVIYLLSEFLMFEPRDSEKASVDCPQCAECLQRDSFFHTAPKKPLDNEVRFIIWITIKKDICIQFVYLATLFLSLRALFSN